MDSLLGESHVPPGELTKAPYNGPAYVGKFLLHSSRIAGPGIPLAHSPVDQRATEFSFGSHHRGFINFAFVDGHVQSVNTQLSSRLAGHLANRHDGQTIGEF